MRTLLTSALTLISLLATAVTPSARQQGPLRLAIAGLVHGHVGGFLRGAQERRDAPDAP